MGWPDSGEIDVMEYVGFEPNVAHGTIHTKAYYHKINTQKGAKTHVGGASDGFHTYALDWNAKGIKIYVDGKQYFGFKNDGKNDPKTWPFNHGMPMILNLAVGGDWGGAKGIDDSIFPQKFEIDYVKVYEPNP
jgi:beta-glucanase (GH16 family)